LQTVNTLAACCIKYIYSFAVVWLTYKVRNFEDFSLIHSRNPGTVVKNSNSEESDRWLLIACVFRSPKHFVNVSQLCFLAELCCYLISPFLCWSQGFGLRLQPIHFTLL